MSRTGQASEQIIANLREAVVSLSKGKTVAETFRALGAALWTRIRAVVGAQVWRSTVLDHQAQ